MNTGPSEYSRTLSNPTNFAYYPNPRYIAYYDNLMISYPNTIGISHIGPYLLFPNLFRAKGIGEGNGNTFFVYGMTNPSEINRSAKILKAFPAGTRGTRAFFIDAGGYGYFWDSFDDLLKGTINPSGTYIKISGTNWINVTGTGYGNPWPEILLNDMSVKWQSYLTELGNCGATLDFVLMDVEGAYPRSQARPPGVGSSTQVDLWNSMVSNTYWTTSWRGISGVGDLWNFFKGSTSTTEWRLNSLNEWAWNCVAAKLTGNIYKTGFAQQMKEKYPSSWFGNYGFAEGYSPNKEDYPREENAGEIWYGSMGGNAASPVLYGTIRLGSLERGNGTIYGNAPVLKYEDPTRTTIALGGGEEVFRLAKEANRNVKNNFEFAKNVPNLQP